MYDTPEQVEDSSHRRARVPDALETMPAGADDDRRLLPALGPPAQRRQIVRHDLQRVEQVIEVLDLGDGADPAQGEPDRLTQDCHLANPGVRHPQLAVLLLQADKTLIDVAQLAQVLAKGHEIAIAVQGRIETSVEHLEAVDPW